MLTVTYTATEHLAQILAVNNSPDNIVVRIKINKSDVKMKLDRAWQSATVG